MAYAAKSTSTVAVMLKNFGALSDEIDGLQKKKPVPKDEIKKLSTELDRKGKAAALKLNELIAATQKDFVAHGAVVDKKVADAIATLKLAKKIAGAFKPDAPDPKILMALTKPSLSEKVKAMQTEAEQDAKDFGKSWFDLRGYNPVSQSADSFKPYAKTFTERRANLMGLAKGVGGKIDKIGDYAEEINVVVNDVRGGFTGGKGGVASGDAEEGIEDVAKEIAVWGKEAKRKLDAVLKQINRFSDVGKDSKAEQLNVELIQSSLREGIALGKDLKSKSELYGKKVAQARKMFGGVSKKGDAMLAEQERGLKTWDNSVKFLNSAVAMGAKAMKKMQDRVDKAA